MNSSISENREKLLIVAYTDVNILVQRLSELLIWRVYLANSVVSDPLTDDQLDKALSEIEYTEQRIKRLLAI